MNQYLTYNEFKWLNKKNDKFDVNSIGKNGFDGYILEFDLEYFDGLLELHNDYPLALVKLDISNIYVVK